MAPHVTGARVDLDDGRVIFRRWPEDEMTWRMAISGLGLVEYHAQRELLSIRDPNDGFPLRSVPLEMDVEFVDISGDAEVLLINTYSRAYLWERPLSPNSQVERLDLPCTWPRRRPQ